MSTIKRSSLITVGIPCVFFGGTACFCECIKAFIVIRNAFILSIDMNGKLKFLAAVH